jgi:hypothetical protein
VTKPVLVAILYEIIPHPRYPRLQPPHPRGRDLPSIRHHQLLPVPPALRFIPTTHILLVPTDKQLLEAIQRVTHGKGPRNLVTPKVEEEEVSIILGMDGTYFLNPDRDIEC